MTATLSYIGPKTELCGIVELVADIVHVGRWTADGEGVQVVEQRTAGPNCVIVIKEGELYVQYPESLLSGRQFTIRRVQGRAGDMFTIEHAGWSGRTYLNGEPIERANTVLNDGDRIRCGADFRFHLHGRVACHE